MQMTTLGIVDEMAFKQEGLTATAVPTACLGANVSAPGGGQDVSRNDASSHDPGSKDCRLVGDILSRVGDKWSMLVVMTLLDEPLHFNELKRAIRGVSQQMLSRTLRALERDGMVVRSVHAGMPVRVEYALSAIGRSLAEPVQALGTWAIQNREAIEESRRAFDQNQ